jgi:hypothetical protein
MDTADSPGMRTISSASSSISAITTMGRASTTRWTASLPRLRPGSELEDQSILPNTDGNLTVEASTSCQSLPSGNSPQTGSVLRVWHHPRVLSALSIVVRVVTVLVGWVALAFRLRQSLDAEVLFLRRQLALYVERGVKPRRIDAATQMSLALLSRLFQWRSALVVVRSQTLIRWHRAGCRLSGGASVARDGRRFRWSYEG